jgi:hypothetical protein
MGLRQHLTRRDLLARGIAGAGTMALAGRLPGALARPATSRGAVVPLPTPAQLRADVQRMVDFGPRLTGSDAHNRYIEWLETELTRAGCSLLPRDDKELVLWEAQRFGLDVLDGPAAGPIRVASYFPRSQETPAGGITGPLAYGGVAPTLSLSAGGTDPAALSAALQRYPADLASWASALAATTQIAPGCILVVDLPLPPALTESFFLPMLNELVWAGHSVADIATRDYKRMLVPEVTPLPLAAFQGTGAAGVVFILDASFENLVGQYIPFLAGFQPIPGLWVDRDAGAALRHAAGTTPKARLTLTATRRKVKTPSIVAVLPGTSDEALIINTHTDGQNFAEENGGVMMVALARHFGSLPESQRLKRMLVFSAVTGHMGYDLPQTQGFIDDHPELMCRAAAALTIEHFGCAEWFDNVATGYHATGDPEAFGVWTSQGRMFTETRDAAIARALPHTLLLHGPVQFGIGGAFQSAGVPQIGAIAGPNCLTAIAPNGHMDKFDETLAGRQTQWIADLLRRLDPISAADLRAGDPSLRPKPSGPCAALRLRGSSGAPGGRAAVSLRLSLPVVSVRSLLRAGRLRGQVRLSRSGAVHLTATLQPVQTGAPLITLAQGVVRISRPGMRRFALRLTPSGRRALRGGGRFRLVLTARYHEPGGRTHVRRVRRLVRGAR